jgi:hypothetical protein
VPDDVEKLEIIQISCWRDQWFIHGCFKLQPTAWCPCHWFWFKPSSSFFLHFTEFEWTRVFGLEQFYSYWPIPL